MRSLFSKFRGFLSAFKSGEVAFFGVEIRMIGEDGLTSNERMAIDPIAQQLGYDNVAKLAEESGFDSPRDMAHNYSFKNARDFFLGEGYYDRLSKYNKNIMKVGSVENS